jgi:hypothetical protein
MRRSVSGDVWRHAGILLAMTALIFGLGIHAARPPGEKAIVTEGISRLLLGNATAGRQALIGSVWWPPLPALVQAPAAALSAQQDIPVAALLMSALFGAAAMFLLLRSMAEWGAPVWARIAMAGSVAASPGFLAVCWDGSPDTFALYLTILTGRGLARWAGDREVRHLVQFAAGAALLPLTSLESIPWVAMVFILLAVDTAAMKPRPGQRGAVLALALLPAAYAIALWVLLNWLIMRDGFYFLRSLASATKPNWIPLDPSLFPASSLLAPAIGAVALILSVLPGDRASAMLAAAALAVPATALALNARGLPWNHRTLSLITTVLAVMAVAQWIGRRRPVRIAWAPAVLLSLLVLAVSVGDGVPSGEEDGNQADVLYRIERHVLGRSRYAKVFVCGREGLQLLWRANSPVFEHAMDFDFQVARRDYRGHHLFVLVHKPVGLAAADSVHWRYPDLYRMGGNSALYDGDWGDWRLFEIIEPYRSSQI